MQAHEPMCINDGGGNQSNSVEMYFYAETRVVKWKCILLRNAVYLFIFEIILST